MVVVSLKCLQSVWRGHIQVSPVVLYSVLCQIHLQQRDKQHIKHVSLIRLLLEQIGNFGWSEPNRTSCRLALYYTDIF